MIKALHYTRLFLLGIAAGLMIAVLYLRNSGTAPDSLDELSDAAILLLAVAIAISLFTARRWRQAKAG